MPRHKDIEWNLPESGSDGHSWNSIHAALLMDIRDELRKLNSKLECYRVTRALGTLERVDRRLAVHIKLKGGRR